MDFNHWLRQALTAGPRRIMQRHGKAEECDPSAAAQAAPAPPWARALLRRATPKAMPPCSRAMASTQGDDGQGFLRLSHVHQQHRIIKHAETNLFLLLGRQELAFCPYGLWFQSTRRQEKRRSRSRAVP